MELTVTIPDPGQEPSPKQVQQLIEFFTRLEPMAIHTYVEEGEPSHVSHIWIDTKDVTVNPPVGFLEVCVMTYHDGPKCELTNHASVVFHANGTASIAKDSEKRTDHTSSNWGEGVHVICKALLDLAPEGVDAHRFEAALGQFAEGIGLNGDLPLEKLELNTRAYRGLTKAGINTVNQLYAFCAKEHIGILRNYGKKTAQHLNDRLVANGYPPIPW